MEWSTDHAEHPFEPGRTMYFLTLLLLLHAPAEAGVWVPTAVVFDPYGPEYEPAPRPDYVWIRGGYDEFGYYIPGYWQPVAPYPGYVWAAGYWAGHTYYEGYWRPQYRRGQAWIPGYYVGGRYTGGRWVEERHAREARTEAHDRARAAGPAPRAAAHPRARSAPDHSRPERATHSKGSKKKHK